jgi:hypothetical protein
VSEQSYRPTWRVSPFEVGKRYRALRSAPALPAESKLVPGEIITYEQSSYSRYDGCSIYHFKNDSGKGRTWLLSDNAPVESWRAVFAPVEDAE